MFWNKASVAGILVLFSSSGSAAGNDIILATTTSTRDSGLLDTLIPIYAKECACHVKVLAVGSGKALRMGRDGEADVLLVHSPADEEAFVREGFAAERLDVMHNDFVLLGPATDPADVKAKADGKGEMALKLIAGAGARFVSRGDGSGTHQKELGLWKAAGISPSGKWYVSAGSGMGEVLRMADEMAAYTLSDRATYLSLRKKGRLDLRIVLEKQPALLNPYGVITVSPTRFPHVNAAGARRFAEWLVGAKAQELIATFGVSTYGEPLFFPQKRR